MRDRFMQGLVAHGAGPLAACYATACAAQEIWDPRGKNRTFGKIVNPGCVESHGWHGHRFTDQFTLLKERGAWVITTKVFHVHE